MADEGVLLHNYLGCCAGESGIEIINDEIPFMIAYTAASRSHHASPYRFCSHIFVIGQIKSVQNPDKYCVLHKPRHVNSGITPPEEEIFYLVRLMLYLALAQLPAWLPHYYRNEMRTMPWYTNSE
jgi:hypothetical protein